jgi:hypothetical protein
MSLKLFDSDTGPITTIHRVEKVILHFPGLTERQIAKEVFGAFGQQQRVNPICRKLVREGKVERRGNGYATDPFTYFSLNEPRVR